MTKKEKADKVYRLVKDFKKKYKSTVVFRLKKHCKVVEEFIDGDEEVIYAFPAQYGPSVKNIVTTVVLTVTSKRLIISQKRLLWGSRLVSITKNMFNDISVRKGLFWGKVKIDTIKELIVLTNISKGALDEIETVVTKNLVGHRDVRKDFSK